MRSVLAFLALSLLLLASCGGRQATNPLTPYAETNWRAVDSVVYQQALRRMNGVLDQEVPGDVVTRDIGPQALFATADGGTIIVANTAASQSLIALVDGSGAQRFAYGMDLAPGSSLQEVSLIWLDGITVPVLKVTLDGSPSIAVLYYACTNHAAMLLRAETAQGEIRNLALSGEQPSLATDAGALNEQANRVQQLAATAHISASGKAATDNAVVSHLERLAIGNDIWLAQASADLLTLK